MDSCAQCKKSPPEVSLKQCAKCNVTKYCSRDCQRANWKTHKKTCVKANTAYNTPPKAFDQPFARISSNTWLHDRSERDVYRLLIDAYRMRAEDENNWLRMAGLPAQEFSLYEGFDDGGKDFNRFLDKVEEAGKGILPPWWNAEKRAACLALGMSGNEWQNLRRTIKISDIHEHYGDTKFPFHLRLFIESIYGAGPGYSFEMEGSESEEEE